MESEYQNSIFQNTNDQPTESDSQNRFEMIAGIIIAIFTAVLALSGLAGDSYGQSVLIANNERSSAYSWYDAKSIKQTLTEGQRDNLQALIDSGTFKEQTNQDFVNYLQKLDQLIIDLTNTDSAQELDNSDKTPKATPQTSLINIELAKLSGSLQALINSDSFQTGVKDNIKNYINDLDKKIDKYNKEKNEILLGSANIDQAAWTQDIEGELGKVIGASEWEDEIATLEEAGGKMDLSGLFLEICLVMGAISLVMQKPTSKWIFLTITIIIGFIGTSFMVWGLTIVWPF